MEKKTIKDKLLKKRTMLLCAFCTYCSRTAFLFQWVVSVFSEFCSSGKLSPNPSSLKPSLPSHLSLPLLQK